MGYMKIPNLYKDQTILQFKQVWVTEKIHGTSAWITFRDGKIQYHSGGAKHDIFVKLFDEEYLVNKLTEIFGEKTIKIHGEHYGGKIQGMKNTYGESNDFVVFDIKVEDVFLSFDKVQMLCADLRLDIVHGEIVDCNIEILNKHRDLPSVQAERKGFKDKEREGIVIRPLKEFTLNNGDRVIAKHKGDNFRETKSKREITPEKLEILKEAEAIADEWVTNMRLIHVLDKLDNPSIERTGEVIKAMIEDIRIEASEEIEFNQDVAKQIGKKTAYMFKGYLQKKLEEEN